MSTINKVKGQRYRILTDEVRKIWSELSFKTSSDDVEFDDGQSLTAKYGVVNTYTLTAGSGYITVPNVSATAKVDIYTNVYGLNPTNVVQNGTDLIIYFVPQSTNVTVKVVVGEF